MNRRGKGRGSEGRNRAKNIEGFISQLVDDERWREESLLAKFKKSGLGLFPFFFFLSFVEGIIERIERIGTSLAE